MCVEVVEPDVVFVCCVRCKLCPTPFVTSFTGGCVFQKLIYFTATGVDDAFKRPCLPCSHIVDGSTCQMVLTVFRGNERNK